MKYTVIFVYLLLENKIIPDCCQFHFLKLMPNPVWNELFLKLKLILSHCLSHKTQDNYLSSAYGYRLMQEVYPLQKNFSPENRKVIKFLCPLHQANLLRLFYSPEYQQYMQRHFADPSQQVQTNQPYTS